jgi:hypothetical protein
MTEETGVDGADGTDGVDNVDSTDGGRPIGTGPRSRAERQRNALRLLEGEQDLWAATADAKGAPTLVPLAFWWDGGAVWLSTRPTNPTGANMAASGTVRLCLGSTRDVVHIEGRVRAFTVDELPAGVGDAFTAKDGWDPREESARYDFYEVVPEVVRAWGTVAEMRDRVVMRAGTWLDPVPR